MRSRPAHHMRQALAARAHRPAAPQRSPGAFRRGVRGDREGGRAGLQARAGMTSDLRFIATIFGASSVMSVTVQRPLTAEGIEPPKRCGKVARHSPGAGACARMAAPSRSDGRIASRRGGLKPGRTCDFGRHGSHLVGDTANLVEHLDVVEPELIRPNPHHGWSKPCHNG